MGYPNRRDGVLLGSLAVCDSSPTLEAGALSTGYEITSVRCLVRPYAMKPYSLLMTQPLTPPDGGVHAGDELYPPRRK